VKTATRPPLPRDRATLEAELRAAGCTVRGNACTCPHPDHDDRTPSASIYADAAGAWRVKCHGCGWSGDVYDLRAVLTGRPLADIIREASPSTTATPTPPAKPKTRRTWPTPGAVADALQATLRRDGKPWTLADRWDYRDPSGTLYAAVLRYDAGEDKTYRPITAEGDRWRIGDPDRWHPYRADELPEAGPVWFVEGEKSADALASVGLYATTTAHGAKSPHKTDLSTLAGRDVSIWPDHDENGRAYAEQVAALLHDLTPPASVRIIEPPEDLPPKGDAVDWLDGRDAHEPHELAATIGELAERAKAWTPTTLELAPTPDDDATRPRGTLSNVRTEQVEADDGTTETQTHALTPDEVREAVLSTCGPVYTLGDGGPLFAPSESDTPPIRILKDPPDVFAWAKQRAEVYWAGKADHAGEVVGKAELLSHLRAKPAASYDAVATLPHHPPMGRTYYAHAELPKATGRRLAEYLDRLNPETDADRELLRAMLLTPAWGGPAGARPMFVLTSEHGRGSGKTKTAEATGHLYGGGLTVSLETRDGIDRLRQRLLAPSNAALRFVTLDNVKSAASSGEIESLITADVIDGHRLHHGDARRINNLTWSMTANGVGLSRDLADRAVLIKLGKPKRADFVSWAWRFIDAHRAELLADILAELQAEPRGAISDGHRDRWAAWQDAVLSRLPNADDLARLIIERRGTLDIDADDWSELQHVVEALLNAAGYDATRPAHVPSKAICDRFEAVTGQRLTGHGLATMLARFAGVGEAWRLVKNPSNRHGRGYLWLPAEGEQVSRDTAYPDWQSLDAATLRRTAY